MATSQPVRGWVAPGAEGHHISGKVAALSGGQVSGKGQLWTVSS